jgi:uncharacterized protein YoxC
MKLDLYTKAILTLIAALLLWNAVNRPARADDATLNGVSDQVASVGSAVDDLQDSVDKIASDVSDIETNGCGDQ